MPTITQQEAIEKGFTRFVVEDNDTAEHLKDVNDENRDEYPPDKTYWLLDIEPTHFFVSADDVAEGLEEHALNQEEYGDEDGRLADVVKEVQAKRPELFQAVADALNEEYSKINFYMPSDWQVKF